MTQKEVAEALRISPARVRQIEAKALAKLRLMLKKRGMCFDDFIPDTPPITHPLNTNRQ